MDGAVTTRTTAPEHNSTRAAVLAFAADAVCILIFVAIGRRNHTEGVTLAGVAQTAWPFLVGLAAGWVLCRAWRAPTAVRPTGIIVWLSTVAIGMVLRAGIGAALVPEAAMSLHFDDVHFRPVRTVPEAPVELFAAWRSDNDNPALAAFLDLLRGDEVDAGAAND